MDIRALSVGPFPILALIAAALAALAVAALVGHPGPQLHRVAADPSRLSPFRPLRRWSARPDAPSLGRRLLVSGAAAVATGVVIGGRPGVPAVVSWVLAVMVIGFGVVLLGRLEPAATRRRRQQLVLDAPQALELLGSCLAAGMPLRRATGAVVGSFEGPVADDLGAVLSLIELGVSDAEAWRTLRGHPQFGAAATDLARSAESGTMMVQALVHHARDARSRRRSAMEVAAKAVGVRSVLPLMICFLPAFMLLGIVPTVASAILNALF